ncbi:hypothetical protein [Achromobacter denitrificans]|uniref:Uncharacterized protein n=1 Tax=Achromobacter denitrificans TaxID=32002 RepID=A0ABZ3G591_ACHDE|nr:hypothetical protein [Achromobacter denitrificans]CAB3860588.1 hypothetical protein LMG1860_03309 [Achromobacter denitrificans]
MSKSIGLSFPSELQAAGLLGLPFSWNENGEVLFADSMTEEQRAAVMAVVLAHDPTAPAPVAVPETVTKYQACVVLARHDLLDEVDAFFASMVTSDPRRLAWQMAAAVHRHSDSTLDAIAHLGLSEAQADGMFIEAAQVE